MTAVLQNCSSKLCEVDSPATLKVVKVDPTEYPCVAAVAAFWEEYARILDHQIWAIRCQESRLICSNINGKLSVGKVSEAIEVYVCRNRYHKIQGIMLLEVSGKGCENSVNVDLLASHPDNICPNTKNAVRGSGRSLLQCAEKRAKSLGLGEVTLRPTYSGEGFYLKNGFSYRGRSSILRKKV